MEGDLSGVAKRVHGVHTASPVFSYPLERFTSCACVPCVRVYEAEGIVCSPCGAVA